MSKTSRIRGRAKVQSRASSRALSLALSQSPSRAPTIQHALFNISARNYVFVGDFIYTFESPTITYFKTFRGADSRLWSYAVSKHRVYLLNYGVVLNDPPFDPFDSDFNPYVYYDAIALINTEPVFVGIAPHYIYYTPNPEFDFEYICGSTYMLRRRYDPQTAITINDYCEMMREFERTHGVEKLNYIPLYC
jgi:hypothetical protein